ncbi:hypothetical protein Ga0076813_13231 [endosymbiont of Ridgeia piscesae]|uniref:Uncharacterized protein n=1 Tax=endosymbiont of Ridgeia piscesae TaxID=54398 RepID=A0A0T5Z5X4_9GAMM|nr:hypothetical protein Ga0076813_13231 [endosymbiont of Ridgeia piscesae]
MESLQFFNLFTKHCSPYIVILHLSLIKLSYVKITWQNAFWKIQ